jgi:D-glycerate 3-kinase
MFIIYRNMSFPLVQVMDFVSRYLPAYDAYLPTLYKEGPNGSDPDHLLVIDIDEERNPL